MIAATRLRRRTDRPAVSRGAAVSVAAASFCLVFGLRFATPNPQDAVTLFYCVPIALLGAVLGLRAGLLGAAVALGLVAIWIRIIHADITLLGYLSRGTAFALVGGLVGRLADESRAARKLWQQFFDLSRDLFCVADTNGYFVRTNAAWGRLLGYAEHELVSRPYTDFVHPEDRVATEAEAELLVDGEPTFNFTNRYRARDGSWHWIEWASRADRESGLIYAAARDVTERRELEERLRELAHSDALTGLLNRRRFEDEVESAIAVARRYGARPALLLVDLDGFKHINDTYGHPAGDAVLKYVAELLARCVRETDRVARFGGDEFAVLLPDARLSDAEHVAAKLCEEMRATPVSLPDGDSAVVSLSIGVAASEVATAVSPLRLVSAADVALYRAKHAGRNGWSSLSLDEPVVAVPA